MTLRKAMRITGLDIVLDVQENAMTAIAQRDGAEVARAAGRDSDAALATLVQKLYDMNGEIVMTGGGWRCFYCGKIVPLQRHHNVGRSRGRRDDSVENLRPTCAECHARRHGG